MPIQPEQYSRLPLVVTMGEPAGIGPDITLSAWQLRDQVGLPVFFVVGEPALYRQRAALTGRDIDVATIDHPDEARCAFAKSLPVLDGGRLAPVTPGSGDPANGPRVIQSIRTAVELVLSDQAAAMVTNPVSKDVLYRAGFKHPGHTEFLGELARQADAGATPVMMLVCAGLRVVPLTIHLPLQKVSAAISPSLIIETVKTTIIGLSRYFAITRPRIAVTGLNPHAGEGGALGDEEITIIAPAIRKLVDENHCVEGPFPADSLFSAAMRQHYDAIIAMYHDQALIPVKTLDFEHGVNVTLGLPFLRTSPDHGTAFEIAGTSAANPASLVTALKMARDMSETDNRARSLL